MPADRTLGQVVVRGSSERRRDRRNTGHPPMGGRIAAMIVALVVLAGVVWCSQVLAAQVRPQRLVIRGCWLTNTDQILAAVDYGINQGFGEIRRNARELDNNAVRWLRRVDVRQAYPRTAVLTVEERYPVLKVTGTDAQYWLCDDGELVKCRPELDKGDNFKAIESNPQVRVMHALAEGRLNAAQDVMLAAACCNEAMPGIIRVIEVDGEGMLNLYDRRDFRIYLGKAESLPEKIGALPKALRVNDAERNKLRYLDASNVDTFYEKWKEPII